MAFKGHFLTAVSLFILCGGAVSDAHAQAGPDAKQWGVQLVTAQNEGTASYPAYSDGRLVLNKNNFATGRTINLGAGGNLYSAVDQAQPGDVIKLSAGNFSLPEMLQMKEGVSIEGSGVGSTIINATGNSDFTIEYKDNNRGGGGQYISNLTMIGNGSSGSAIEITRSANIQVDNVHIKNFVFEAVRLNGQNLEVANSFLENNAGPGQGSWSGNIMIYDVTGLYIHDNKILENEGGGIKGLGGVKEKFRIYRNDIELVSGPAGKNHSSAMEIWQLRDDNRIYLNNINAWVSLVILNQYEESEIPERNNLKFYRNNVSITDDLASNHSGMEVGIIGSDFYENYFSGFIDRIFWMEGWRNPTKFRNVRIFNNIAVNCGGFANLGPLGESVENIEVFNNTVVNCGQVLSAGAGDGRIFSNISANNNIHADDGGTPVNFYGGSNQYQNAAASGNITRDGNASIGGDASVSGQNPVSQANFSFKGSGSSPFEYYQINGGSNAGINVANTGIVLQSTPNISPAQAQARQNPSAGGAPTASPSAGGGGSGTGGGTSTGGGGTGGGSTNAPAPTSAPTSTGGGTAAPAAASGGSAGDSGGIIVLEAENPSSGLQGSKWQRKAPNSEASCQNSSNDYVRWESNTNDYGGPADTPLTFNMQVSEPGAYILRAWACQGTNGRGDEENDAWISVNGSEATKFYSSTGGEWGFYFTEDHDEQKNDNKTFNLNAGSNVLQVYGRSMNFALDKLVFYKAGLEEEAKSANAVAGAATSGGGAGAATGGGSLARSNSFRGRIAYSTDGNDNDPDDIGATPMSLALMAYAGLQGNLVHFDYNSYIWNGTGEQYRNMSESATGGAQRFGYDTSVFVSAIDDPGRAQQGIANAINASSADDPLTLIVGGPMEVACQGIKLSQKEKRQYVTVISHSGWNNRTTENNGCVATEDGDRGAVPVDQINDGTNNIKETGVAFDQIQDQNRFINTRDWSEYDWLENHPDQNLQWVHSRMRLATGDYADPSDAGMVYYVLTGDEDATPAKLEAFFASNDFSVPPTVGGGSGGAGGGSGGAGGGSGGGAGAGSGVAGATSNPLSDAVQGAQPGDTVTLDGGTYRLDSPEVISASGERNNPIIIEPAGDEPVILDAAGLGADEAAVEIEGSFIEMRRMTVINAEGDGINVSGSDVRLEENIVSGSGGAGISVGSDGGSDNVTIIGNEIMETGGDTPATEMDNESGGLVVNGGENIRIMNNFIYDNNVPGILVSNADGGDIKSNRVQDNAMSNLVLDNSMDLMVEQNEIFNSEEAGVVSSGIMIASMDGGAGDTMMPDDLMFENNYVYGTADGVYYDSSEKGYPMKDAMFKNNTFFDIKENMFNMDESKSGQHTMDMTQNIFATDSGDFVAGDSSVRGAAFSTNCWTEGKTAPTQASGNGNVELEITLANDTLKPSLPNNVVSTDRQCQEMEAGVIEFETLEFTRSEIDASTADPVPAGEPSAGEPVDDNTVEIPDAGPEEEELQVDDADAPEDVPAEPTQDTEAQQPQSQIQQIVSFITTMITSIIQSILSIFFE